jgi:hypothetical protein
VKVIRSSKEKLAVQLSRQEKLLLIKILDLYPLVPSSYQKLSRAGEAKDREGNQRLLDEALAEQRDVNKRRLRQFLEDPRTFEQSQGTCRMHLGQGDLEWLLQVLNDVRVGSWIALGSPDAKPPMLNPETTPQFWVMEIAGFLEASLVNAWDYDGGS